jgi:hypothetical protein
MAHPTAHSPFVAHAAGTPRRLWLCTWSSRCWRPCHTCTRSGSCTGARVHCDSPPQLACLSPYGCCVAACSQIESLVCCASRLHRLGPSPRALLQSGAPGQPVLGSGRRPAPRKVHTDGRHEPRGVCGVAHILLRPAKVLQDVRIWRDANLCLHPATKVLLLHGRLRGRNSVQESNFSKLSPGSGFGQTCCILNLRTLGHAKVVAVRCTSPNPCKGSRSEPQLCDCAHTARLDQWLGVCTNQPS